MVGEKEDKPLLSDSQGNLGETCRPGKLGRDIETLKLIQEGFCALLKNSLKKLFQYFSIMYCMRTLTRHS